MSEERQFVQTYLQLIALAEDAPADKFNSTADYDKIDSLGPSLPKLEFPFPKLQQAAVDGEAKISFAVKSIKPPFKFSTTLEDIPVSSSIHKIKADLIESVPVLKAAHLDPSHLKLMLKSKVVQDTATLSSLQNVESFMCMVTAPEPAPAKVADEDPDVSEPIIIGERTWTKILDVLTQDLGEEKAKEALAAFKANWK